MKILNAIKRIFLKIKTARNTFGDRVTFIQNFFFVFFNSTFTFYFFIIHYIDYTH